MHSLGIAVAFGITICFSLTGALLQEENLFLASSLLTEDEPSQGYNFEVQDSDGSLAVSSISTDWPNSNDLTSAFNDPTVSVSPDQELTFGSTNLDFTVTSNCGGGKDNLALNKLRVRADACVNPDPEQGGVMIPQIFRPDDDPVLDQLENLVDENKEKCLPPYFYNLCCVGTVGLMLTVNIPRVVWSTVSACYACMYSAGADFTSSMADKFDSPVKSSLSY